MLTDLAKLKKLLVSPVTILDEPKTEKNIGELKYLKA